MTRKEVLDTVVPLDTEQRVQWLIDLGWAMTVSTRADPLAMQTDDPLPHLMSFNELQRQLFNYLRHSRAKDDWAIEDFIAGLCQRAKASGVER
jgi:hypothetical protein